MSFPINFIIGNNKPNTLFGMTWADQISALGGNDTIYTGDGNDTVMAGDGDDLVANDRGDDVFWGNKGFDTLSFKFLDTKAAGPQPYNSSVGVIVDLALDTKQFNLVFGLDEYHNFENVQGGGGSDVFYGTNGANNIYGGEGDDRLYGRGGDDTIEGSVSADTIMGGKGADTLAGYHADTSGGDGESDLFIYKKATDSGIEAETRDVLYGLFGTNTAVADRIDLHLIDANPDVNGDQSLTFVGNTAFTKALVGEVRVMHVSAGLWSVVIDLDKDNAAEMSMRIYSTKAPVEADFIL